MIINIHYVLHKVWALYKEQKLEIIHSIALKSLTINIRLVCLTNKIFNFNFGMFVNKYR